MQRHASQPVGCRNESTPQEERSAYQGFRAYRQLTDLSQWRSGPEAHHAVATGEREHVLAQRDVGNPIAVNQVGLYGASRIEAPEHQKTILAAGEQGPVLQPQN